ncbi:cold shock domain-containing protein [Pontibacter sp. BAB1700]|uniref:cold shock domain-containing protein n=1 Tax=Pontibacter sp. BAB1700 TaxID=1144253 RepID=UPI00026BC610|nr:cold shock domain-containing protein [Pontibacter sp. BAB1700]EJF08010.1 hypothetical protein O71_23421 [Pontibacter sp. BAB1700]
MERVLNRDFIGEVRSQHPVKGYGFIVHDEVDDVFISASALRCAGIVCGDEVCFHIRPSETHYGKSEAYNVRKVFRSKDGKVVYDRINSHLHARVTPLLAEIVGKVECGDKEFFEAQVGFNRIIGENTLVKVEKEDNTVYAVRRGRAGHTKFVMNRQPVACSNTFIVLKRTATGGYVIITAFIGELAQPEPWSKNANLLSLWFWKHHALIYDNEEILQETLTNDCPWLMKEHDRQVSRKIYFFN